MRSPRPGRSGEDESSLDPYAAERLICAKLVDDFYIDEDAAFDLVVGYGSEAAARAALMERWWRGEVERRNEAA